jgi:transcriptional regulator with XRE-family HTH domain
VFPNNNIRQHRIAKGWNQREAARAVGIDASDWCALERGRKLLTKGLRNRLSKVLDIQPDAL